MAVKPAIYRSRNPQATDYYRCIEEHPEPFIQRYEERFERAYGFFRPYLQQVIYRYLDCGNLHNGFARVKCRECNHEYLLAFSCKRHHFCPSCHQNASWNSGSGFAPMCFERYPTGISYSASRKTGLGCQYCWSRTFLIPSQYLPPSVRQNPKANTNNRLWFIFLDTQDNIPVYLPYPKASSYQLNGWMVQAIQET